MTGDPEKAIAEVIQRGVDILVPCGSSASVAARRLTLTIPIIFISVGNPVGMGLVESLSNPARNVTGFSDLLGDLGGKLIDLSKELSKPKMVGPAGLTKGSNFNDLKLQTILFVAFELKSAFGALTNRFARLDKTGATAP